MTLLALSVASWIGLSVVVAMVFGVVIRTVDRHEAALRTQRPIVVTESSAAARSAATAMADQPVAPAQPGPQRAARLTVVA